MEHAQAAGIGNRRCHFRSVPPEARQSDHRFGDLEIVLKLLSFVCCILSRNHLGIAENVRVRRTTRRILR